VNHAQTVEFLSGLGVAASDILDDAPEAGLWLTAAGLRRLIAAAPDDSGTFAVRALLNGGAATAGVTIIIQPGRDQTPRPQSPQPRRNRDRWFRRFRREPPAA